MPLSGQRKGKRMHLELLYSHGILKHRSHNCHHLCSMSCRCLKLSTVTRVGPKTKVAKTLQQQMTDTTIRNVAMTIRHCPAYDLHAAFMAFRSCRADLGGGRICCWRSQAFALCACSRAREVAVSISQSFHWPPTSWFVFQLGKVPRPHISQINGLKFVGERVGSR